MVAIAEKLNTLLPKPLTLGGITIESITKPAKHPSPIYVTPSGIVVFLQPATKVFV